MFVKKERFLRTEDISWPLLVKLIAFGNMNISANF